MSLGFINQARSNDVQKNAIPKADAVDVETQKLSLNDKSFFIYHIMFAITCFEIVCVSIPLIVSAIQLT